MTRGSDATTKLPTAIVLSPGRLPPHHVCLVGDEVSHERLECQASVWGGDTIELAEPGEHTLPDIDFGLGAESGDQPQVVSGG